MAGETLVDHIVDSNPSESSVYYALVLKGKEKRSHPSYRHVGPPENR